MLVDIDRYWVAINRALLSDANQFFQSHLKNLMPNLRAKVLKWIDE